MGTRTRSQSRENRGIKRDQKGKAKNAPKSASPQLSPTSPSTSSSLTSKLAFNYLNKVLERVTFGTDGEEQKSRVFKYFSKGIADLDQKLAPANTDYIEIMLKIRELEKDTMERDKRWIHVKTLGEGGYGEVELWRWRPDIGTISGGASTSTIKASAIAPSPEPLFFASKDTRGGWKEFGRYCNEGSLTRRLNTAGCINVPKVYDWVSRKPGPDDAHPQFTILYHYYRNGDLHRLAGFYGRRGLIFPEGFLWHIFHCLANTVLYCAHGEQDPHKRKDWETILHRDIKPENIYLDTSPRNDTDPWPELLLGDFGLAHGIGDDIRALLPHRRGGGTKRFKAPLSSIETESDDSPDIDVATDIYSIGRTIEFLMFPLIRNIYSYDEIELIYQEEHGFGQEVFPYSTKLGNLIHDCTKFWSPDRIDIWSLWSITKGGRSEFLERATELKEQSDRDETNLGTYEGDVLWSVGQRDHYRTNKAFREKFNELNNWACRHDDDVERVHETSARLASEFYRPRSTSQKWAWPDEFDGQKSERTNRDFIAYRQRTGIDDNYNDILEEGKEFRQLAYSDWSELPTTPTELGVKEA